MLVSCKTAYFEGHYLYYSSNMFHLPPGSFKDTFRWVEALQPKHKNLIRRIGLRFGLSDMTPAMIEDVNTYCAAKDLNVSAFMIVHLYRVWEAKLLHLANWNSLEEIQLEVHDAAIVVSRDEIHKSLRCPSSCGLEYRRHRTCSLLYGLRWGVQRDILERFGR